MVLGLLVLASALTAIAAGIGLLPVALLFVAKPLTTVLLMVRAAQRGEFFDESPVPPPAVRDDGGADVVADREPLDPSAQVDPHVAGGFVVELAPVHDPHSVDLGCGLTVVEVDLRLHHRGGLVDVELVIEPVAHASPPPKTLCLRRTICSAERDACRFVR